MKLEDPCPPGLNGAIGAAAGLLKAAIRSLNEFEDGLSATGGGPALGAAVVAGGDVAFAIAGQQQRAWVRLEDWRVLQARLLAG